MLTDSGQLTYCTNIHAGESWPDHFAALQQYFPIIKEKVSPLKPMGIGLRLSNVASLELIKEENLLQFKKWLTQQDAYVFTMNGFPYGNFHHTRVKDQVHAPDWTTDERVEYTSRLFSILEKLLPPGMDGGISTSPLSYRHWFSDAESARNNAIERATSNILKVLDQLIAIKKSTAKILHLDIEPEPDGLLETGTEFIAWFETYLLPAGINYLKEKHSVNANEAESMVKEHIRLCYDVCHFAIGYEPHQKMVETLQQKGIKVGKIQLSAALKADLPASVPDRKNISEAFSVFDESTYLHQVVARKSDNALQRYKDLPDALTDIENPLLKEWRAHFHVPVFLEDFGRLQSTQSDITEVLKLQHAVMFTRHLEVETYTWEVLPDAHKLPIDQSIIRELLWIKNELTKQADKPFS